MVAISPSSEKGDSSGDSSAKKQTILPSSRRILSVDFIVQLWVADAEATGSSVWLVTKSTLCRGLCEFDDQTFGTDDVDVKLIDEFELGKQMIPKIFVAKEGIRTFLLPGILAVLTDVVGSRCRRC